MNGDPINFENGVWEAIAAYRTNTLLQFLENPVTNLGGLDAAVVLGGGTSKTSPDAKLQERMMDERIECFYYIARCESLTMLNKYLDYNTRSKWLPPIGEFLPPPSKWPSNLFEGVSDSAINSVLATLDIRDIGGRENLKHFGAEQRKRMYRKGEKRNK